jgi:uncharacterized protein
MEYLSISWEELQETAFILSQKILSSNKKIDLIVGIARGGVTISHLVSDFLSLPLASFTISSYQNFAQVRAPLITYKLGTKLSNKRILLIDDISDTGNTFIHGMEHLKEMEAHEVYTASLFIKPWTKFTPDFYVKKVDEWVIFPFDVRESIESLKKTWADQDLTREQIEAKLMALNLQKKYIKIFIK